MIRKLAFIALVLLLMSPVHADYTISPSDLTCSPIFPNTPGNVMDGSLSTFVQGNNTGHLFCYMDMGSPVEIKTRAYYQATHDNANYIFNFYGTNNSDYSGGTAITQLAQGTDVWPDAPAWRNKSTSSTHYVYQYYIADFSTGLVANLRAYEMSYVAAGTAPEIIANFTATPTQGSGPLPVLLEDTSENTTVSTTYTWSITPATGWTPISGTINSKDFYVNFVTNGNYTISHGVQGAYNSANLTRNDYIWVYNSTSLSTTHAVARDLYTGFAINGAQVDMYDVENASWTNTTTTNGEGSITTLFGRTLNIWGSASGYDDDNLIGVPEVNGGYYSLLLKPSNITTYNTTAGNLTLVVTVQDLQLPHPTITGAEVTAAWGSQYASGTTNAAGNTFFTVPNNTAIHLSAFKSGYASGSKTHITGSANGGSTMETAVMYIGTDYVTPVPSVTLTTGPGGTIPQTVDPYPCVGDGSAQDTANCQRKQSGMAADLISYGPDLMDFFIMLTFIGGLLLITGKRR